MEPTRRTHALLALAILAVGVAGVAWMVASRPRVEPQSPPERAPLVRVVETRPETIQFVVRAHGTVIPRTESDLVAQVAGEIEWVSPSLVSGGFFQEDELLVRIESVDYETDRESARAAVARARSEFSRAKTELERQQRLARESVTSQARIDDAENAYRVAEAVLREARARLVRADRDLARTAVEAPFEGRVRSEQVDVGQFVSRGTAMATLYAVDWAEVRLPLPDRELRYLDLELGIVSQEGASPHNGPEVRLHAEFAGEPHVWTGRIVRTEGEIDPRTRMVNLIARVEDPYGLHAEKERTPLAVGLFVEAEILGRTAEGVFELPRAALREGPEPGSTHVHVVDPEGRLHIRPVEVLRTERERVVIGAGLEAGERVSVSPLEVVVDGMAVRVASERPVAGPRPASTAAEAGAAADPLVAGSPR